MSNATPNNVIRAATDTSATRLGVQITAVVGFALLTALTALIRYPLPGTPVPATLQTLSVVLAGLLLGPRLGALSMGLYLAFGICGQFVFASAPGPAALVGPTAGYLVGFVLAQPMLGWLVGPSGGWRRVLAATLAGQAVI